MSENLSVVIADITRRLLASQESRPMLETKACISSTNLKLVMDHIKKQMQGRQFGTLQAQVDECKELLQQFSSHTFKMLADIQLIREILADLKRRVDERQHYYEMMDREAEQPKDASKDVAEKDASD